MAGRLSLVAALVWAGALGGLSTAGPASAATFVVKSTADSGPGSLRAAIDAANATPGADVVKFNIPGTGPFVISLLTPLPTISQPVVINGSTQPGFAGTPLIQLDRGGSPATVGLVVQAGSVKVTGLSITHFAVGVAVDGANDAVSGCWIGLDPAGTQSGNTVGIQVSGASASGATIGGNSAAARNVISGNTVQGVTISGPGALVQGNYIGTDPSGRVAVGNHTGIEVFAPSGTAQIGGTSGAARNVVEGNYIGLTASGKSQLGNGGSGIQDEAPAPGNTIGGTSAGARNVVSGNAGAGIDLASSSSNVVEGNFVGTDATGSYGIGNSVGILVAADSGNRIGGTSAAARNVVSGQRTGAGVDLENTDENLVQGNYIGVDAAGSSPLPNDRGIRVRDGSGNTIGGLTAGAGNVVSANRGEGILLLQGATGMKIQGNMIGPAPSGTVFGNGGAGVVLDASPANFVGGGSGGNTIAGNDEEGVLVDARLGDAGNNA